MSVIIAKRAVGIIGAAALGRIASAFLYGVAPADAATFAGAAAVLVLATGAASFLLAWRAAGMANPESRIGTAG